jgi:hypothetical protein
MLCVAAIWTLGAGTAVGATPDTYKQIGTFSEAGSQLGQVSTPTRIAVYGGTGEIFVVDRGNNRVQVFQPSGESAVYLTQIAVASPYGVAIDQANGALYVSSAAEGKILKFARQSGSPPTFNPDPSFVSPSFGSGAGEVENFDAPIAVDPSDGSLVVADRGDAVIQRYAPDGKFENQFDGSNSGSEFRNLRDLAVDAAGNVIVIDGEGSDDSSEGDVERYSAAGAFQTTIGSFAQPGRLAIDSHTGYLVVTRSYGWDRGIESAVFSGTTELSRFKIPAALNIAGTAVDGGASGRFYAFNDFLFGEYGSVQGYVFKPGASPAVEMDPPSGITSTEANLSGRVNPRGTPATWRFEYSSDGSTWYPAPYPYVDLGSGEVSQEVEFDLKGLQPNTEYRVRLVAVNTIAETSKELTIHTSPGGPTILPLGPAPRLDDSARLNARVNPNGLATTYHFEYGPSASYGSSAPMAAERDAGAGTEYALASAELTGLAAGTEYHYRLVATNSAGTTVGDDQTFTTRTAAEMAPPRRGIEMITPPDKGNQNVLAFEMAADGNKVIWRSNGGTPLSTLGHFGSVLAERVPGGWQSRNLMPTTRESVEQGNAHYLLSAVTDDLNSQLYITIRGLIEDSPNTFVRMNQGKQEVLHTVPIPYGRTSNIENMGTSSDLAHIYSKYREPLDPEHVLGTENVYDYGTPSPVLVSRLPDGSVPSCGVSDFVTRFYNTVPWNSEDGSRVLFASKGDECGEAKPTRLYLVDRNTNNTRLISQPVVSGSAGNDYLVRTNRDFSALIFVSGSRLAADDTNEGNDLYRWVEGQGNECLTCSFRNANIQPLQISVGDRLGWALANKDLSYVYFVSEARLFPGLGRPQFGNLYVWHDGEVRYVAPVSYDSSSAPSITPDGSKLLFQSEAQGLTADDSGGWNQSYLYDASDQSTECISCRESGSSQAQVWYLAGGDPVNPYMRGARAISPDGKTVVFITRDALVRRDVNRALDIYEWRAGRIHLLTDGETKWPGTDGKQTLANLSLYGMSEDTRNILFSVGAPITGYEQDSAAALYDMRADSDLGPPPAPAAVCVEDACQGPLVRAPDASNAGSASFSGPGNSGPAARKAAKRHRCAGKRSSKRCKQRKGKSSKSTGGRK